VGAGRLKEAVRRVGTLLKGGQGRSGRSCRFRYSGGLLIGHEDDNSSDQRSRLSVSRAGGIVRGGVRPIARNMGLRFPQLGWVPRSRGPPIRAWTSCRPHGSAPLDGIVLRSRTPECVKAIARDDPGRQISLELTVRSDGQYG
jgi:hypothetical protein